MAGCFNKAGGGLNLGGARHVYFSRFIQLCFLLVAWRIFRKDQFVKPLIIFRGQGKRLGTKSFRWDKRIVFHF